MKTDVAPRESEQRFRRIAEKPHPDDMTQESGPVLTTLDITESKQSNEITSNLAAIVESSDDAIVGKTLDGVITSWNRGAEKLYGYSAEETKGRPISILVPPNRADELAQILDRIKRGERVQHYETIRVRKDGKIVEVSLTVSPIQDPTGAIIGASTIARDITERKHVEDELRRSHMLLLETGRMAKVGGWEFDVDTLKQRWTDEVFRIHEVNLDYEPTVEKSIDFYAPEDRAVIREAVQKAIATGEPYDLELRFNTAKGNHRWVHAIGKGYRENGRIVKVGGTFQDITERKQVEEALQLSEAKYRALVENTADLIFMVGEKEEIMSINPAATRMLGKTVEQVLGKSLFDVYPKEIATMFSENVRAVLRTGKNRNIDEKITFAGNELWINTRLEPLLDDRGKVYAVTGVARDITQRKQMEEAVRNSERKYRTLFEKIPQGIYQTSLEGKLVTANPAIVRLLGYDSEKELLALNVERDLYVNSEDRKTWMERIRTRGEIRNAELVLKCKDGEELTVLDNAHVVRDERGAIQYYEGTLTDLTERKRMEEELSRSSQFLGSVIENAYVWLDVLDNEQNVLVWNKAAETMSGYSREEVLGHDKVWEWLYPDREYRKKITETVTDVLQSGRTDVDTETRIKRKDGQTKTISWNERALTDQDGKAIGTIAIGHDITERKQVERLKDEFVSVVSHELRTPLTSIRASLGLLTSGVFGTLPEKGERILDIAVTNTDRLVRLINDILDSERLASGKTPMEKKQCSTAQLVRQASDVMKPMAEKAGISLSVESQDAELWVDPDRIVQALTNLISNAIKFSPKGGTIWVTAERKENQMLFKVQDEGRGIPPDKLGLLFARFQQLDSSDAREKGGSGLGLSISRSIIEQHNGKIWVDSSVGKGSTFLITIPLPLEEAPLQHEATAGAPSTRKVLIIEDDSDLANILAAMLERHDIQPHIALTGGRGIALSKQVQPDLIVLDLILPDMDGSMVVEGLRKDNILRSVPLVVYTVKELDKRQRENLRLGETLFFTKSRIPPEQFEEKVVQFMKHVFENRGEISVS